MIARKENIFREHRSVKIKRVQDSESDTEPEQGTLYYDLSLYQHTPRKECTANDIPFWMENTSGARGYHTRSTKSMVGAIKAATPPQNKHRETREIIFTHALAVDFWMSSFRQHLIGGPK